MSRLFNRYNYVFVNQLDLSSNPLYIYFSERGSRFSWDGIASNPCYGTFSVRLVKRSLVV